MTEKTLPGLVDPSCLVSMVQAVGGGVIVWGLFSWHSLGPLSPTEHHLSPTASLSIIVDHIHPFMTLIFSNWFVDHDDLTVFQWPPQAPDISSIQQWFVV